MATVRTPFTDTLIQRRVISEMIGMIEYTDAPLLQILGVDNDKRWKFNNWPPGNSKKIEWLEDTMSPRQSLLDGAISAVQTNLVVDNGEYFHTGHVFQIDTEYMVVESRSNNTLTVVRAVGGTTAATHADNAVVYIRTIAKKTGANYTLGYTTTMSSGYNYCQEIEEGIQVNNDQSEAKDYAVSNTMQYHLAKKIGGGNGMGAKGKAGDLPIWLANMAYYGKRQQPTDSVPGMAGGLDVYITTNVTGSTTTPLARMDIEARLRTIWAAGGKPDLFLTSAWGATKIASFYEGMVRTTRNEKRGGYEVKYISTAIGQELEVVVDWMLPANTSYILDSDKIGWVTIQPFGVYKMPAMGQYEVNSIFGEYSFAVLNEKSHAKLTHSDVA